MTIFDPGGSDASQTSARHASLANEANNSDPMMSQDFRSAPPQNLMYKEASEQQPLRCRFTGRSFGPLFRTHEDYTSWSRYIRNPANQFDYAEWMLFDGAHFVRHPSILFMPVSLATAREGVMRDFAWAAKKRCLTGYANTPDSVLFAKQRVVQDVGVAAQRRIASRATLGFCSAPAKTSSVELHPVTTSITPAPRRCNQHSSPSLSRPLSMRGGGTGGLADGDAPAHDLDSDPPASRPPPEPPPVMSTPPPLQSRTRPSFFSDQPTPLLPDSLVHSGSSSASVPEEADDAQPSFLQFPKLVDAFLESNASMDLPYEGNAVGVQILRILDQFLPSGAKRRARELREGLTAAGCLAHVDTVAHNCMDLLVKEHVCGTLGEDALAAFDTVGDEFDELATATRDELQVEQWQFTLVVLDAFDMGVGEAGAGLVDNVLRIMEDMFGCRIAPGDAGGPRERNMENWLALHPSGANRRAAVRRAEEQRKADEKEVAREKARKDEARGRAKEAQRRAAKLDEARRHSRRLREADRRAAMDTEQAKLDGRQAKRRWEAATRHARREVLEAAMLLAASAESRRAAERSAQVATQRRAEKQAAKASARVLGAERRAACRLGRAAEASRALEAARSRTAVRSAAHAAAMTEAARERTACPEDDTTRVGDGGGGRRGCRVQRRRGVRQLRNEVRRVVPLIIIARDEVTI